LDLLRIRDLPFLSRRNYLNEFRHIVPWSVLAGLVEGNFGGVVVSGVFNGGDMLIAIAVATPLGAFLFSLVWGMLCVGRPKVRLLTLFSLGAVLAAGTVAVIPRTSTGAVWFVAQMAAAQVLFAGVVTIRPAIWKSNYPTHARGRITARLQSARVIVSTVATLLAAHLFDRDPQAYGYVYPIAALAGLVAIHFLTKIHVRGERRELGRAGRSWQTGDLGEGMIEPFSLTALLSPGRVLAEMVDVLRSDRRFARYLVAQFVLGAANMLPRGVIVVLVTRELQMWDSRVFWVSVVLADVLPKMMLLGSLRLWGRLFDRVGVVRFRVIQSCVWSSALVFGLGGTLCVAHADALGGSSVPLAVILFAGYALTHGIGRGGGMLAWHIGHLHFASPQRAEVYMGLHVSLTGIRGAIMPLLGVWIWGWIGGGVWLVSLFLMLTALVMFTFMARREIREGY